MKTLFIFIGALTFLSFSVGAQNYPRPDIDIESFIEELFAVQDEDLEYEDIYEAMFQLYRNPIDLNRTDREELRSFFVLSEKQINSLLNYLDKNGKLLTIYELQAVPEFDLFTIERMLPFVTVRDSGFEGDTRPLFRRIISEPNNYLIVRHERIMEEQRGFTAPDTLSDGRLSSRFLGSPNKIYSRFRTSHVRDFSFGFTTEKDPGEQIIWDPETNRYGMDFYSIHLYLENKGRFKKIALGDYQLQFGQSLLLGAGFNIGKGAETINTVRRNNLGIRPYTSVLETGFFRGAAFTYELDERWDLTTFYSNLNQDGRIQERQDSLEFGIVDDFITAIQITGFHRTPAEIEAKNAINEQTAGANLLYTSKEGSFQGGFTAMGTQFSTPIQRTPNNFNQYEFNGSQNYNLGAFFNYNWQNFAFFGEGAISQSGGKGAIAGFAANMSRYLEMSMVLRSYDRDFHTFYGLAFGEGTRNINEQGAYFGVKFSPNRQWTLTAYYDRFRFPWLRFRINEPSSGFEYLSRLSYRPKRGMIIFAQFRQENKALNVSQSDLTEEDMDLFFLPVAEGIRRNWIVNTDYGVGRRVTFKSRVQGSSFDHYQTFNTGYAIMQDANVDFGKVRISTRLALFDTEGFQNRQYAFEKDVLYAFSVPAYNGQGVRNMFLIQWKPTKKYHFWFRYARTRYTDGREAIGTGLQTIEGSSRSDIKVQTRIRF
ncbi:MAG: helix-hairpin-helix domain-containing protein [Cyclobacteriaceae bacterium]|nr:helix-hairpin-helix domain-containing protein [Cyclobacteriaceae bacterium]